MNLYQIDAAILDLVDPETGEILDWEAFDALQMERDEKIENVALWYKNLVAEAIAIRNEEKILAERRMKLEKMAETRKKYLEDALGGQKFQTAKCAVSFRKTSKVALSEPALAIAWAVSHGYGDLVVYKAPEISKADLARILKTEESIPGAELVYSLSCSVK